MIDLLIKYTNKESLKWTEDWYRHTRKVGTVFLETAHNKYVGNLLDESVVGNTKRFGLTSRVYEKTKLHGVAPLNAVAGILVHARP